MTLKSDPRIALTERAHDWHTCIEGNPAQWESGRTSAEAVEKLRISFPDLRGAEVVLKEST